ncbi:hypothetical protein G6702_01745 [Polynucleobacter paneuropaeus]|nr:hypothetical protein G6702_01745 [Polynucleobacter paneuropaeus]
MENIILEWAKDTIEYIVILKFFIVINIAVFFITLILMYKKIKGALFLKSSTYFLGFTCLYCGIPAFFNLDNKTTYINADIEYIVIYSIYSIYFMSVLNIYYIYSNNILNFNSKIKNLTVKKSQAYVLLIYLFAILNLTYGLVSTIPWPIEWWGQGRVIAATYADTLNADYKTHFCLAITGSIFLYYSLINRGVRLIYLLLFVPFITIDIITTGRLLLTQCLLMVVFTLAICGQRMHLSKIILIGLLIISIEKNRTIAVDKFSIIDFINPPMEIMLTSETALLTLISDQSLSILYSLIYSLKIFLPFLTSFNFFNEFKQSFELNSPLSTGMGGSLFMYIFAYKSILLTILYPFICIIVLKVTDFLLVRAGFFGKMNSLFFVMYMPIFFREGLSLISFYYVLFAGSWYWLTKIFILILNK